MLEWQQIDTVLLDLDGTLLDLHFDNHFWLEHLPKYYAEREGIGFQQACDDLFPRFLAVKGTLPFYCLDHWSRELDMDVMALKHEVSHLIQVRAGVEEFLQAMRTMGKRVYLATNAHRHTVDLKLQITGIDQWLDGVYSSHDFGFPKEEQAFWQQLNASTDFQRSSTLFIDDNLDVLKSARRYGIHHILGILEPDSQRVAVSLPGFEQVDHFTDLLDRTTSTC